MKKITEYKVLTAWRDPKTLERYVMSYLNKGWTLYGDTNISSSSSIVYSQTMIKIEEVD